MATNIYTEQRKNFDDFIMNHEGRELKIILPPYFRDNVWACVAGKMQYNIEKVIALGSGGKIKFDLTRCRWIDPLPLMSILVEIANSRKQKIAIEIKVANPDHGAICSEIGPYQSSPNRLLWFLEQEGFFESLKTHFSEDRGLIYPDRKQREAYHNINVTPSYEDARCIPLTLFFLPTEAEKPEFALESVEKMLVKVDSRLDAKIASKTRERLIYKLRVTLQEALHNAQEHAYPSESSQRILAIYVRYRTGGLGLDTAGGVIFKKHADEERSRCSMLNNDWLAVRKGCVEVFLLDRGIGMVESFERSGKKFSEKYKFSEAMKLTYVDGISSKKERETRYGGLHLLHGLLVETGDFVRAYEHGEWFGSGAPLQRENSSLREMARADVSLQGLALHFRLAWKAEADYGDKWTGFEQGEKSEIWPELSLSESECVESFRWFDQQTVIDERFGEIRVDSGQGKWVLWLVKQHRMKWDILSFIKITASKYAKERSVLLIADIPSYEAETYAAALAELKLRKNGDVWPAKFSHIILCTNRWRFVALKYVEHNEYQHGFSPIEKDLRQLGFPSISINPKPINLRLAIVRWLKWHDSRVVWGEINKHGSMFISELVEWGQEKDGTPRTIQGFLDFPRTTRNNICSNVYRASLARILGVLPTNTVRMNPVDHLTSAVLREMHASEIYEPATANPQTQLALGSVLVSGTTLEASSPRGLDLHFFLHQGSPLRGTKPGLLFWLPSGEIKGAPSKLARIGKTAAIAPCGWKSFEVPRFDQEEKSVGARGPRDTYGDWQSSGPVILKIGHWSNQSHHDFVTINIAGAVEAAFLEGNELARFIVEKILSFIGIGKDHVNKKWHRFLENSKFSEKKFADGQSEFGLMVYRSHPVSESVIGRLVNILTPDGRDLAAKRIFPILPIRTRCSGSALLVPPLVREEIRHALYGSDAPRRVLLFDDAAISGRTLEDLRAALSAIGATHISTMIIANRLRHPAESLEESRIDYFWRLDVPVIGREGNCPLCHALHLTESFCNTLASKTAKTEVNDWIRQWSDASALDKWSSGLRPLPLEKTYYKKRYCFRQDKCHDNVGGKYLDLIDIVRSTGLVVHVSEIHAMTGRDDYCIKKIIEHKEPEVRIEIAASQLFLFGNEFDVDMRMNLIETLIRELASLKEASPHIPLAVLAAVNGLSLISNDARKLIVNSSLSGLCLDKNYASRVFIAYLVCHDIIGTDDKYYKLGARLLSSTALSLSSRLKALFLETLSPLGNPHSGEIPLLLDDLMRNQKASESQVRDALDSFDHIEDLVNGLESSIVRKDAFSSYEVAIKEIFTIGKEARKKIILFLGGGDINSCRDAIKNILSYLDIIKLIADGYFYRIVSPCAYIDNLGFEKEVLEKIIEKIDWARAAAGKENLDSIRPDEKKRVVRISSNGCMAFDKNAREVWIPWFRGIPGIVLDLMRNAIYSSCKIKDPRFENDDLRADMWVFVDYNQCGVDIILANGCSCRSREIFSKLKKHRWSTLIEIGGSVEEYLINEKTFGVKVNLPYAAYMKS